MNKSLKELRWDCESILTNQCYRAEKDSEKNKTEYKCTCPDPSKWTLEKCLEFLKWEKE